MTAHDNETIEPDFLPSLGIRKIISNTFSMYISGFLRFFPLGFVIWFASYSLTFLIYGDLGQTLIDETGAFDFIKMLVANSIYILGSLTFMSVMTLSALDFKSGHGSRVAGYIYVTLANIFPILILQVVYVVGISIGAFFLIVPGLYLLAMWSLYLPAILIDGAGFRGLNRSAQLTKNYRWSVLGPLAVFLITSFVVSIIPIILYLGSFDALVNPAPNDTQWASVLIYAITSAIGGGIYAVGMLNIFDRLKEIKETGGITEEFRTVFD